MTPKNAIITLAGGSILTTLIMWLAYDFNFLPIHVSNAMFVTGVVLFFLGIIKISGATSIFESTSFAAKKMAGKTQFKTFQEYQANERLQNFTGKKDRSGDMCLIIAVLFMVLSASIPIS